MTAKTQIALFVALCLMLMGCAVERNVKLDVRLPLHPAIEQVPLRIGLYYSPEFLAFTKKFEVACSPSERSDIFFNFPIGAASRDLFDQIIASMFTSVTRLSNLSQSANRESSLDGLLEPQIESFAWESVCSKPNTLSHLLASIRYRVNLYDPGGQLVASMQMEGFGYERPRVCFGNCKDSFATEQAIQDAMAKFMLEFCDQPEVKHWTSTLGISCGDRQ